MSRRVFSRRTALMQLAAIPITCTLARTLMADPPRLPKRLVIFMQNNGTKRCDFWPKPVVRSAEYAITKTPILNSLFTNDGKTDNGLLAKANLIRGMTVFNDVHHGGNEHDTGFARMFTGAPLMPTSDSAPWGGSESLDQTLAREWNVQSLTTAVYSSSIEDHPHFGNRASFSYVGPQTLNLPLIDPLTVYANTFPQADAASAQRLALRKSVLDSVTGDLQEVGARLGADDRQKVDLHLTAVRQAEVKLSNLIANHGSCAAINAPPRDFRSLPPGLGFNEINVETYVPDMIDAMITLVGAALKCGLTRVGSVQFGYGGGRWNFGWRDINMNHHADIAHLDHNDDVGTTDDQRATSARVTIINQFYAEMVRRLAVDLDSVPEGSGTMLDNTLVVWANEFGRGDHQLDDIPAVLIGLVGNGIARGGLVRDVSAPRGGKQQPHNILGYHILNALGHATPGFGDIADMQKYAIPGF
jgi:hypothetical protein